MLKKLRASKITLRDEFASHAMIGILSAGIHTFFVNEKKCKYLSDAAKISYEVADAMLAEREKKTI